jgi:hypothetical protein
MRISIFSKERRTIMKRVFCFLIVLVMVIAVHLSQVVPVKAQETGSIEIAVGAICRDVVDRQPLGVGNSFPASVGKLYCFTKIVGALSPIEISHVWYFGYTERARVNLAVGSSAWRTNSSKIIQSHEIGDWRVDVLGPGGEVLQTLQFKITP